MTLTARLLLIAALVMSSTSIAKHIKVKLYTPQPYQRAVHIGLAEHWEDSVHLVKSTRQAGKSVMCENVLVKCSFDHPKQQSIMICPTYKQGKKIYRSIAHKFKGTPLLATANASDLEVTFTNGSQITFLSAEQGDNLRGFTVSKYGILIIDEAAYVSDDVFYTATPFVNANKAPILAVSTPRFRAGFFYDFYTDGIEGKAGVFSYNFADYPNPYITAEKLEMYRRRMPVNLFRADYLGEWMEATSDLFGDFAKVMNNTITMTEGENTAGLDWGVGKDAQSSDSDYTALSVFNGERQQVRLLHFNDLDETATIAAVVDALLTYRVRKIVVETNSIGRVYLGLLKKAIANRGVPCRVVEFNTTNESKRRIIEQFIVHVQNRTIQLLDEAEMKIQMSAYQMERTAGGKVTYNAASGYHDDCIIATSLALYGLTQAQYILR